MDPSPLQVQRLWALADGTVCLLMEREDAPHFEVCVVRGDNVIRQNRLYARGAAHMLAETWRSTLEGVRVPRSHAGDNDPAAA